MSLPNNKRATEKRLMYLKKRFQRDPKFHEDYNKFMEEIISKGYAKESQQYPKMVGNGVYHIAGSTIQISSAVFKGRSINKELIPGPDLASQLVGILTQFRENKVAFMADIKKLYFQVIVAEEH